MRYSPMQSELSMLDSMEADERLHYAITRMNESEEVWSLGDSNGWRIQDIGDKQVVSIWPYRILAEEYYSWEPDNPAPQSTSLEHFIYDVLSTCEESNIWLQIYPKTDDQGCIMKSSDLYEILSGMLETNEYFIEG